jgi:hypothetical protein
MSANYKASADILKRLEGGYCNGAECGTAASGETYRGIDRKQAGKNWPGWALIDQWKKTNGRPKYLSFFTGPIGALIDNEVEKFWSAWWNRYGLGQLTNQHFAGFLFAWSAQGQNRAIADANRIAQKYGAKKVNPSSLTPEAAAAINSNVSAAYTDLRSRVAKWYTDNKQAKIGKQRLAVFPTSIANRPTQGSSTNPLSWVSKMFGLTFLR